MKIEDAAQALDVQPKLMEPFDVVDPFNDNRLRGFLCHRSDRRYGAIILTHVGHFEALQTIYAVPKFPYPFDRQGTFRFPAAQRLEAYEKLDGTSVFGYVYRGGGKEFVTYKLRLHPVLRDGRFGSFLAMWREMLERYPAIPGAVSQYLSSAADGWAAKQGLAFELFGRRNKHLIVYEEDLDCRLVFGVTRDGLEPPSEVFAAWASRRPDDSPHFPAPPEVVLVKNLHDLRSLYRSMQAEMDSQLEEKPDLEGYVGPEGRVWYMLADRTVAGWTAFKCKPETIEAIHFATGGISKEVVRATAYNVLEMQDEVSEDALRQLLAEEFTEDQIAGAAFSIMRVVTQVNEEIRFRKSVTELYNRLGLDLAGDKRGTMRALSEHFPKGRMRHVYALLAEAH